MGESTNFLNVLCKKGNIDSYDGMATSSTKRNTIAVASTARPVSERRALIIQSLVLGEAWRCYIATSTPVDRLSRQCSVTPCGILLFPRVLQYVGKLTRRADPRGEGERRHKSVTGLEQPLIKWAEIKLKQRNPTQSQINALCRRVDQSVNFL